MRRQIIVLLCAISAVTVNAQWTTSGNNAYNTNTGNIGIGITNPVEKLQLVGNFDLAQHNFIRSSRLYWQANNNSSGLNANTRGIMSNNIIWDNTPGAETWKVPSGGTSVDFAMLRYQAGGTLSFFTRAIPPASPADPLDSTVQLTNTDLERFRRMTILNNGNVGIGTASATARMHVVGTQGSSFAKFTQSGTADADAYLSIENGTTFTNQYIPALKGRSYTPTRPYGLFFIAEADDVTPVSPDVIGAAIVLNARSKTGTALANNSVLAVNNLSQNLLVVRGNGNVGIATTSPDEKLTVNGNIKAKKLIVTENGWADYVFDKDYNLLPLNKVADFINQNKHLPGVPSAKEVSEKGIDLGDTQAMLLKKIEELTLYIIDQDKVISQLKADLKSREGQDAAILSIRKLLEQQQQQLDELKGNKR